MLIKPKALPRYNTRLSYSNTSKQQVLNPGMAFTGVAPITLQKYRSALL